LATGQFWVNNHAHVFQSSGSNKFLAEELERQSFVKYNTGTAQPKLNSKTLLTIKVIVPTLPEQQKIAEFLTAVDEKIGKLKRKKELLEAYKKGAMQKLFSQEIRFKDDQGNPYPDWEEKRLGEFLDEHGGKSEGNEAVFSVSVHKGLINQIAHLGRRFAADNTSHYNRVYAGDIVYTKSPTGDFPLGIIKRNQSGEIAIISPLYGVFTPESNGLGIWLDEYFSSVTNTHNYLHSIIQKGAKNTINITNKTFLSKGLRVPINNEEQELIGEFFDGLNDKITAVTSQIDKAAEFKKGLLQKMFVASN
jgi:type I restriction enzyme S subunit